MSAFKINPKLPKCVFNRNVQLKILHHGLNQNIAFLIKVIETDKCQDYKFFKLKKRKYDTKMIV